MGLVPSKLTIRRRKIKNECKNETFTGCDPWCVHNHSGGTNPEILNFNRVYRRRRVETPDADITRILLVVIGNMIPKSAEPLSGGCCEPSREQSLRRFTGWTFVFAGLGFSTVWLFAPIEVASTVSIYIIIASFLLVIVPFVWSVIKRKRLQPPV